MTTFTLSSISETLTIVATASWTLLMPAGLYILTILISHANCATTSAKLQTRFSSTMFPIFQPLGLLCCLLLRSDSCSAMLRETVAGEEDATSLSSMLSSQAEVVQGGGEEGTERKARSKGEKKKDKKKDKKKTAAQEAEQQPAASQAKGSSSVPAAAVPAVLPEGKQNTAEEEKPKAEDQASGRRATRNAEAMASQLAKTRKAKNEIWTGDQSKLLLLMM